MMDKNHLYFKYVNNDSKYFEKLQAGNKTAEFTINHLSEDCLIRTEENSPWKIYSFANKKIKDQGWKIHVSATMENAQQILADISQVLIERKITFKHLLNKTYLHSINSKNGNRISSGKFITIYPPTDEEFYQLLHILYDKVKDQENGPYILSDKCWKNSNIYYRYGGFVKISNEKGEFCIKDPTGQLIPDNRTPYYQAPEFVKDFDQFLELNNHFSDANENNPKFKQYKFQNALRFTNGGGIYIAERNEDKRKVVIKEARPKVGLDGQNKDAIDRLQKEYEALSKLADVKGVVKVVDYFKSWKHLFLVEEHVEGIDMKTWIAAKYPFHRHKDKEIYLNEVKQITLRLIDIVTEMHGQNVGMGDLQPANIMITKDLEVTLIDFESADHKDREEKAAIHTMGFSDHQNRNRKERDWYAVKKILRYCVLPIGPISNIEDHITSYHNEWIKQEFGSEFFLFLREIENRCDTHLSVTKEKQYDPIDYTQKRLPDEIGSLIEGLRAGMLANLVPDQGLIHGDIRQFEIAGGATNVLTGGTGAALALFRTGNVDKQVIHWIEQQFIHNIHSEQLESQGQGLFTGKAGIAATLYELGYKDKALELFRNLTGNNDDISLRSGLAGIGLALISLYFEENNDQYLKQAESIASHIIHFLGGNRSLTVSDWAADPAGLIDGWSGVSLFFTAMYAITRNTTFYVAAQELVELDLKNTHIDEDLQVLQTMNDRKLLIPYLAGGSIGIGVAIWYLNHVSGQMHYQDELKLIVNLNHIRCTFTGGLFDGAGGFLLIPPLLEDTYGSIETHKKQAIDRLNLFLIFKENHCLFPGNFCYRLSDDLYSGSAGIILGLQGILESNPLYWLPVININQFVTKTRYMNTPLVT
ncbi:class III lanthionine synthetase LanKC [Paenibacillus woosongensis]|nr:class III lanthionine synthetase LanKC [Paenibacillus woosongensis]